MASLLTEEQLLLRDSARDFLARRSPVDRFRELRDSGAPAGFDRSLWAEMAYLGWPSVSIPEALGGLGYGFSGMGILLEECGRTLASSPMLSTALMGATALAESGNEALCNAWLPRIAAGESLLALAVDEHRHHRPRHVALTAAATATGYVLSGTKQMALDGHVAHAFIVSARTSGDSADRRGISLFLVDRDLPGIQLDRQTLLDNHGAARIGFRNVEVSAGSMLGQAGAAWPLLQRVLDGGRIGAASEMLGIAGEAFERTLAYLRERRQFGVPIGSFQALQHRAAILYGEIELCRSVVRKALQALDERDEHVPVLASLAKARAGDTARLATAEAIQMHGGVGMTDQYDLGFFMKRYQALERVLGDTNFHLERFARLRGY